MAAGATASGAAPGTRKAMATRTLGRTGRSVSLFGLGGEGVLRTDGRMREAVPVIRRAIEEGVTYFDTAPAYQSSRDYLGAALGDDRKRIFLASKTHARDADGTSRLIEDSLRRLKTDYLDLLQLHDLRGREELEEIFGKGGALEACLAAQRDGRVRHLGITGHHDPAILSEAMRRHPFDAVLTVVNPAEPHGSSFMRHVIPEARRLGMGVIGMKVLARGRLFEVPGAETPGKALRYCWSSDVDTAIVGCESPEEVSANAEAARNFSPLPAPERAALEAAAARFASALNPWKRANS